MIEKAAEYNLVDIKLGQKKKFQITITESMVNEFARISGDYNPLHMDDIYASSTKFNRRVCHGMLLASFFSRLVGMYLPGKNALYMTQSLKFISPCFINDEITIEGEVL
jgi:acyl dehydratase